MGDIGLAKAGRLIRWDGFLRKRQCSKVDAKDAVNPSNPLPSGVFWVPLEARLLLAWRYPKSVCGLCLLQKSLLWRRHWVEHMAHPTPS